MHCDLTVSEGVLRLMAQAQQENATERRSKPRFPYFRPVYVYVENEHGRQTYSAFSRDISGLGMGLLHNIPLTPGDVDIEILEEDGNRMKIASEVVWSQSCGEGWHISGIRFLD